MGLTATVTSVVEPRNDPFETGSKSPRRTRTMDSTLPVCGVLASKSRSSSTQPRVPRPKRLACVPRAAVETACNDRQRHAGPLVRPTGNRAVQTVQHLLRREGEFGLRFTAEAAH
ncbi:hypothetical protein MRX96_046768 [Rhipicephalus microplus]